VRRSAHRAIVLLLRSGFLRRRWERPEAIAPAHSGGGGWVARYLTTLLRSRDVKVQAAALSALASLAKDNHDVAVHLARAPAGRSNAGACSPVTCILLVFFDSVIMFLSDSPVTLTLALGLCKSRSTDVQLAAGLW
jgi:armadillo repeat-containing protein 8